VIQSRARVRLLVRAVIAAAMLMQGWSAVDAQRGGPRGPQPLPFENHDGFVSMFDGASLSGWDGDPTFWRAEANAIVGQTTADKKLTENTFLIWRRGAPADFER
jgi:hypothetical protein